MSINKVPVAKFLSSGFRDFSKYDCEINLPSLIDGLKISQRKAMWTVLNNPKTMTVEQLGSLAASYTKYHHGAAKNMGGVIVGITQDFTGSNNVNWLNPQGQFGNILNHNASSERYISTNINSNWRNWFKKDDDIIMEFEVEDGDVTEPKFFIPLVPTILFNGSSGIGTGYATNIHAYNPADVVAAVKKIIEGKKADQLVPRYNGYKGEIKKVDGQTIYNGVFVKENATAIRITQLPIGYDLEKYKEILVKLIQSGEIKDFDDNSTEAGWDIIVYASREWIKQHESIITEKLKLVTKDTENIVVWDENKKVRRFNNVNELLEYFVKWRLARFEDRRVKLIELNREELVWLKEKRRFIEYFIANSKRLVNLGKDDLYKDLEENKFVNIDRLMQIRVYNMTKDEIASLDTEIAAVETKVKTLESTTAKDMYKDELKTVKGV